MEKARKEQSQKDQEISSLNQQLQTLKHQNNLLQHQLLKAKIEHESALKELIASHNESTSLREK